VILYLDTSTLVKLYVPEAESAKIRQVVEAVEVVASSRLSYVEARAAFARKLRECGVTRRDYRTVLQDFDRDWQSYFIVNVSDILVKVAAELAEKHALRAYDGIHLASAVTVRRQGEQPVTFSSSDGRLSQAARREGLKIVL
jgi:uncharacterized protein